MASTDSGSGVRGALYNADEGRLRAGWRIALGVLAFVLALVVGSIAGAVAQFAAVTLLATAIPVLFFAQFCWNVLVTGALAALAVSVDHRPVTGIGLGGADWWPNLAFGLVLGVAMTGAVFAVELAAGLLVIEDTFVARPVGEGGTVLPVGVGLAVTTAVFLAVGVGEEVFARGYLMTNLAEGLAGWNGIGRRPAIAVAALASSAVFGLLHLGNPDASALSTLNITLVGCFFAATYVVTDDLGIPIGVHVTWNLSLASLWGFPVSGTTLPASILDVRQTGDPTITGGGFGPEGGLVLYLALAVGIALTWAWVRWRGGTVSFREDLATPVLRGSNREG